MAEPQKTRFDALDGLRGVAALAVMLYHYSLHNGLHWLPGAWASVDLFFILSGFVLAHSYAAKIQANLSLVQFVKVRLQRLWPLAFVGLLLGLTAAILTPSTDAAPMPDRSAIALASILGALWIPYLNHLAWPLGGELVRGPVFPLNDPAWSLFFELAVNLAFWAWVHRHGKLPGRRFILCAYAVFIATLLIFRSLNPGWGTANFWAGFPRVTAEFFLGCYFYAAAVHKWRVPKMAPLAITLLALVFYTTGHALLSLVNVLLILPATVALLSSVQMQGRLKRICAELGELSYPLYVVHIPIFRLLTLNAEFQRLSPVAQTLAGALLAIVCATLLQRVDGHFRRWIVR